MWFTVNINKKEVSMNLTINNVNYSGQKYIIKGKDNKSVPYLYNKVCKLIEGKSVPATFDLGNDVITLSPFSDKMANLIRNKLDELGIKLSKEAK